MMAIPLLIALGFRTYDNHQFQKSILRSQHQATISKIKSSDLFVDDCMDFLLNFQVNP